MGKEYLIGQAINTSKLKETEEKLKLKLDEINRLKNQLQAENIYLRKEIKNKRDFENIIGESEPLIHAIYRVEQVASMDTTVLLEGEMGTGKELFARAIHNLSDRRNEPFVKVNCAALSASLIESGEFELANKGTLFLDEIGELPIELQPKLLQALQDRAFEKAGSSKTMKVDTRIIAATNRNLEEDIGQNRFRKDLYYFLNVYPITIAPLRDRISDIPLLVENFVKRFNLKLNKRITKISKKTIKQLQSYSWPGNIS